MKERVGVNLNLESEKVVVVVGSKTRLQRATNKGVREAKLRRS